MNTWHVTPIFYLYLTVAIITIFVAISSWKMRSSKGAKEFCLMTTMALFWTLGYMLGIFNSDYEWKLLMFRIQYVGLISTIYFWLLFTISYSNHSSWSNLTTKLLLAIIPVLSIALVITMPSNSIFYKSYQFVEEKGVFFMEKVNGIGFYIWIATCFIYTLGGAVILILGVIPKPKFYHRQIIPMTVLVILVLLPTILRLTGNNPIAPYDPTPLSFSLVGLFMLFQFRYYRLFDLVPVTHEAVFKNVRSGVLIIDQKERILEMNPAAERIFDRSQNDVLGKNLEELLPENNLLFKNLLKDSDDTIEVEFGQEKAVFEIQSTPLRYASSKINAWIIILTDITKLKNSNSELEAYARTVAHDLKNPLANQIGFIDLLLKDHSEDEQKKKILGIISDNATKMMSIIDSLLFLSKVRNAKNFKRESLNMADIVKDALTRLGTEVSFEILKPDEWPEVLGNSSWVEEAWYNYLSNAIKYGGSPARIELGADILPKSVKFWVKDNGEGISEDEKDSLFVEFSRLSKHSSKISGHGLGLAIVKRIIQKLDGEVGVDLNEKNGCTFYFTLPLTQNN